MDVRVVDILESILVIFFHFWRTATRLFRLFDNFVDKHAPNAKLAIERLYIFYGLLWNAGYRLDENFCTRVPFPQDVRGYSQLAFLLLLGLDVFVRRGRLL